MKVVSRTVENGGVELSLACAVVARAEEQREIIVRRRCHGRLPNLPERKVATAPNAASGPVQMSTLYFTWGERAILGRYD